MNEISSENNYTFSNNNDPILPAPRNKITRRQSHTKCKHCGETDHNTKNCSTNQSSLFENIINNKSDINKSKIMKYIIIIIFSIIIIYFLISRTVYNSIEFEANNHSVGHLYDESNVGVHKVTPKCTGNNLKGGDCGASINRLVKYCNEKIFGGKEGTFPDSNEFELRYLLLTIRHGDRSSIHQMPGSPIPDGFKDNNNGFHLFDEINEEMGSHFKPSKEFYVDPRAFAYASRVSSYLVKEIIDENDIELDSETETENAEIKLKLENTLSSDKIFRIPDFALRQGQLTTRGFMQLVELGEILNEKYKDLIDKIIVPSNDLYVRSTNYERTVLSVAALMTTLLPKLGGVKQSKKGKLGQIIINTYLSEHKEVMHGLGMRQSSHQVSHTGEAILQGECKLSAINGINELKSFVTKQSVNDSLQELFGAGVKNRQITDLVDTSLPKLCHNKELPCSISNNDKCLSESMLGDMMQEADRFFCNRYTGKDGGSKATRLATYPFINEILSNLKLSAMGDHQKLSLYAGHDTVISPVLASLGIYSQNCIWPPYASRISFELWQPKNKVNDIELSYIRVIFNGEDMTPIIPRCKESYEESIKTKSSNMRGQEKYLCPLSSFEKQVQDLLGNHETFKKACEEE